MKDMADMVEDMIREQGFDNCIECPMRGDCNERDTICIAELKAILRGGKKW